MKIYFTRHGETKWNKEERIQGWGDSTLTRAGRNMALKLREKAKSIKFDAIYSSDLARAYETAKLICPDQYIYKTPLLREINVGYWSGRDVSDIKKSDFLLHERYFKSPKHYNRIDGESFYDLEKRVRKFFQIAVYDSYDQNILVVSHGVTIIAMFLIMENLPIENFWDNRVRRNAEFNIANYENGKFQILKKAPLNPIDSI